VAPGRAPPRGLVQKKTGQHLSLTSRLSLRVPLSPGARWTPSPGACGTRGSDLFGTPRWSEVGCEKRGAGKTHTPLFLTNLVLKAHTPSLSVSLFLLHTAPPWASVPPAQPSQAPGAPPRNVRRRYVERELAISSFITTTPGRAAPLFFLRRAPDAAPSRGRCTPFTLFLSR